MGDWYFERVDGTVADIDDAFDDNLVPKKPGRPRGSSTLSFSTLDAYDSSEEDACPSPIEHPAVQPTYEQAKQVFTSIIEHLTALPPPPMDATPATTATTHAPEVTVPPHDNTTNAPPPRSSSPVQPESRAKVIFPRDNEEELYSAFYMGVTTGVILGVGAYVLYRLFFCGAASAAAVPTPPPAVVAPPPQQVPAQYLKYLKAVKAARK